MRVRTGCLGATGFVVLCLGLAAATHQDAASFILGALLYRDPGPPGIATGLDIAQSMNDDNNRIAQAVTERLRRKFPTGSNQTALRNYLQQQGFRPVTEFMPADQAHQANPNAMLYWWGRQGPVCTSQLTVAWVAGEDRRLREINTSYNIACM